MSKLLLQIYFLITFISFLLTTAIAVRAREVTVLRHAHAHNDYYHARPLVDALEHGFASVEVDIFLHNDMLLVGHSANELKTERSLEALYLEPLLERFKKNNGNIYPSEQTLTLLIDIKSDGPATYAKLEKVLPKYREMLTEVRQAKVTERAVTVVISGNRPVTTITQQTDRLCGVDGRFPELSSEIASHAMPLVSERWWNHFDWEGEGPMPKTEQKKLRQYVSQVHAEGRRLRFWSTPESPVVWKELLKAQVDLIGTDELGRLRDFLVQDLNK